MTRLSPMLCVGHLLVCVPLSKYLQETLKKMSERIEISNTKWDGTTFATVVGALCLWLRSMWLTTKTTTTTTLAHLLCYTPLAVIQ